MNRSVSCSVQTLARAIPVILCKTVRSQLSFKCKLIFLFANNKMIAFSTPNLEEIVFFVCFFVFVCFYNKMTYFVFTLPFSEAR